MRHRVSKKKMNMDTSHRTALLRNLSRSLIIDEKIETTLAKAKFVQPYIEKLVTKAKVGNGFTQLNRVNAKLRSRVALRILFDDIANRFADRNGGYTRIVKTGFRKGDSAPMARLEWVVGKVKPTKTAKTVKTVKAVKASAKSKVKTPKKEEKK